MGLICQSRSVGRGNDNYADYRRAIQSGRDRGVLFISSAFFSWWVLVRVGEEQPEALKVEERRLFTVTAMELGDTWN